MDDIILLFKCLLIAQIFFLCFLKLTYAFTVTLAWDANTEPDLAGYNIYYKTESSADYENGFDVYTSDKTKVIYSDSNQVLCQVSLPEISGATYYFVATAYDTSHNESGYSNEVSCVYDGEHCTAPLPVAEICDNKDNDCDGYVDEGLSRICSTPCGTGTEICQNGQWIGCSAPLPIAEICDNKDNDCDGYVDERLSRICSTPCGTGTEICQNGQWIGCSAPLPIAEICDNKDNDCDGYVDEGLSRICSTPCGTGTEICQNGQWIGCSAPLPIAEI
ncbi:MAG: MopE-related protein, partial [bacterium]